MMAKAGLTTTSGEERTDAVAQLRALYSAGEASSLVRSDAELLADAAEAARRALRASSVSIERFERERGQMRVLVNVGELGPDEVHLPDDETYKLGDFSSVRLLDEGVPGIFTSLDDQHPGSLEHDLLRSLGKHRSLEVPIRLKGAVWGELFVTRTAAEPPFAPSDLEVATAVAVQVAAGIAHGAHARRAVELAYLDTLTGVANRAAIEDWLTQALEPPTGEARLAVTVMIGDVNGLKLVNDQCGHDAGDRLLIQVAELISAAASRLHGSLVGRLGGDEFCLAVKGADVDLVIDVVGDLCRRAAQLPAGSGLACGIASTADDIGQVVVPRDLLRLADGAQYRAKRAGGAVPVVAGRTLPADVARVARRPTADKPRAGQRLHRQATDRLPRMLNDIVHLLDDRRGASVIDRLALVGDAVAKFTDAVVWWVSTVVWDGPEREIVGVRYGAYRATQDHDFAQNAYLGTSRGFTLREYPETARAMRGGWLLATLGDAYSDPAEQAILAEGGYTAMIAAGGSTQEQGFLLEVFVDQFSAPIDDLGPAMRALVGLALSAASIT